jgi:hypothetical protein
MKHLATLLLVIIYSTAWSQSGITWGMSMDVASSGHDNMHPRVAVDGSGNPLVIWGRMSDASVFFSRWTGTMFTSPVKLNPSWLTIATASWMGPHIAAKGDTVYVVVKRTPEDKDTNRIFILRSFDGGQNFSQPIELGFIADSMSRFPTVAIDDNGNPVVGFMKFNSMFMESRWAVARSNDFGTTFSPDVKASGWSGMGAEVCDCCPGSLLCEGNNVAMIYRDNLSNIRDMWTGISNNSASTFTSGFSADTTNFYITSCPSSGPDGVIVGDTLFTVFMSGGSTGSYRVYLSKTSVSTGAMYGVGRITGNIAGLTQQNYPRIAKAGKAVGIVWKQNQTGSSNLPMLFTNNIENGFPASYDTVKLGNVTNTDVAISNGKVWVVWQDDQSGTVKYRAGTFTPDTMVASAVPSVDMDDEMVRIFPNPASGVLNIELAAKAEFTYTLYNTCGEKMRSGVSNSDIRLSTTDFSAGVYFLRIQTSSGLVVKRFVCQ